MKVAVVMGSISDLTKVEACINTLKRFGVEVDVRCYSAHRTPKELESFILETSQNGTEVISTARINSNFFTKVNATAFKPEAKFRVIGKLLQIVDEQKSEDGEMVDTGRLVIRAALVGYADKTEVIKFIVEEPTAISFIKANWKEGDTVQMGGRLRYTNETVEQEIESGFGEAEVRTFTRRTREFLIERGSAEGLDEENSYNDDDIKAALAQRKERMEQVKQQAQQPKPQTQATTSSNDFGF